MITLPDLWNPGICGRLGNQLFEIAAAYAHAVRTGHELVVPKGTLVDGLIRGPLRIVPCEALPTPTMVWRQPSYRYSPIPYPRSKDDVLAIHGYLQSYRYFEDVEPQVHDIFLPNSNIYFQAKQAMDAYGDGVVALCVRRGDYVEKQDYHPLQPHSYYEKAVALFPEACTFLVFSDDISWCEANLRLPKLQFCREPDSWKKMWMMSMCDHHIIANSSYHFWGAKLNIKQGKRVVAPATWFGPAANLDTTDLCPTEWIRI